MSSTKRYWVWWWSGNYAGKGCTKPPFQPYCMGHRDNPTTGDDEQSLCALLDSRSGPACWEMILRHFPDAEQRFCEERAPDWTPGDRFPGVVAWRIEGGGA